MIESSKRKRSKVLIATGVVQLLIAGAALTYFFYLNGNAESAKSVGSVINDALTEGPLDRAGFQSLSSSASALPVASKAMMVAAAFQLPQQRPTPTVSPNVLVFASPVRQRIIGGRYSRTSFK
jgi:hypothetical protein